MVTPNIDINRLSREQRLELIEELWESLATTPEDLPLSDAQRTELDRRLVEMDSDDNLGVPWDEVMRQIRGRV
jgi:putative addiction module component (TIGR02574 family)